MKMKIKEGQGEVIQRYLSGFVKAVLSILVCSSSSSHGKGREKLIVTCIKFLTTVCKSGHHVLFSSDDVLQQICESILIPNVMLRDDDEELFETDPVEFIKRDMEEEQGGIVIELLRAIAIHYKEKLRIQVGCHIWDCLHMYNLDTKCNWKYKVCALRLIAFDFVSCQDMLNDRSFFDLVIVRELNAKSSPMIIAGVLKLLTLFRYQISKGFVLRVLPRISLLLNLPSPVVNSYAAICIKELLMIKGRKPRAWRYTPVDIRPVLQKLMTGLFTALSNPKCEENQYVMECIFVVVRVGDLPVVLALLCLENLTIILDKVPQNPKSCLFNQYHFDSLIALIRRAGVLSRNETGNKIELLHKKISLVTQLENKLYPFLQMVLARNIRDFFPYAFRLLADLAIMDRPVVSNYFTHIFDVLRLPDTWTRPDPRNYPFLKWTPPPPVHKLSMIRIYHNLVSSSDTDNYGFHVLNTVVENQGFELIAPYVRNVWISLFNRLQIKGRLKSARNCLVFMSRLLLEDGCPQNFVNMVNAGVPERRRFQAILEHVWIFTLGALTRLFCDCPDILDIGIWGKLLDSIMTLLSRRQELTDDDDEIDIPKNFVVSLSNLFADSTQGREFYHQAISQSLGQANHSALLQLFDSYNVSFF